MAVNSMNFNHDNQETNKSAFQVGFGVLVDIAEAFSKISKKNYQSKAHDIPLVNIHQLSYVKASESTCSFTRIGISKAVSQV